jgi:hypothetical protein
VAFTRGGAVPPVGIIVEPPPWLPAEPAGESALAPGELIGVDVGELIDVLAVDPVVPIWMLCASAGAATSKASVPARDRRLMNFMVDTPCVVARFSRAPQKPA